MSWVGYEGDFDENFTRNQIINEVEERLEQECPYTMTPHHQSWKFFEEILASREDAEEFLQSKNLWRKKNRAVRYRLPAEKTNHPRNFKAEFIGCSTCKSKIAKKYLKGYSHSCPVCKGELWSQTTQDKVKWYVEADLYVG